MDKRSLRAKEKARKLRVYGLCSGRGEAPPNILAKQEDEDGIRLLPHPVSKPQPPIVCKTENMMITVIIVGKGWLKEEMIGRK